MNTQLICQDLPRYATGAPPAASCRRAGGFTLVEMLVVMGIVAILVGVGVPSFRYVTNANRIASEVNGLLGDMQFARAEAIKEGQTVTICSSNNGATCANSASWANGWIVFNDPNNNKTVDAPTETVRRAQRQLGLGDTFLAGPATSAITFNREGFAFGLPGTITLALHDPSANIAWTRCLEITIVGHLKIESHGTGACL